METVELSNCMRWVWKLLKPFLITQRLGKIVEGITLVPARSKNTFFTYFAPIHILSKLKLHVSVHQFSDFTSF